MRRIVVAYRVCACLLLAIAVLADARGGETDVEHAGESCVAVEGIDALLDPGRVLLLGEIHGTVESPAFVSSVACHALEAGLSVTVGLEWPRANEAAVRGFLESDGSGSSSTSLFELPFWKWEDGRASEAMFRLVERLRELRQSGRAVAVTLLDQPGSFDRRDAAMAGNLVTEAKRATGRIFIVLTGNLHNRIEKGSGRMGAIVLEALGPYRVVSLDVSHSGGSAWICTPEGCGPVRLRGSGTGEIPAVRLDETPGYHGIYHVGSIEASPPAIDAGVR